MNRVFSVEPDAAPQTYVLFDELRGKILSELFQRMREYRHAVPEPCDDLGLASARRFRLRQKKDFIELSRRPLPTFNVVKSAPWAAPHFLEQIAKIVIGMVDEPDRFGQDFGVH